MKYNLSQLSRKYALETIDLVNKINTSWILHDSSKLLIMVNQI